MAVAMQLEQKHSGLGIASFILGLGGGLLTFLVFFVAGIIGAANGGEIDEESVEAVMIGLFLMLFVSWTCSPSASASPGSCRRTARRCSRCWGWCVVRRASCSRAS
jgi:hypothetical protein